MKIEKLDGKFFVRWVLNILGVRYTLHYRRKSWAEVRADEPGGYSSWPRG